MLNFCLRKIIAASFILLLFCWQNGYAKKMYRWVDGQGRVFFSDQVPQDQIKHKRESLNKSARVVDIMEEAKTKEQIELEKRLKILRMQQEKIIAKQKSNDKVLLSTFRNVDDMKMALRGKLAALDAQRKVAEGNLLRLQIQLQQQQKKAASYERNGQKVPKTLLTKIAASKEQIDAAKIEIHRHIEKRVAIKKDFEMDIARFSFLTQSRSEAGRLSNRSAEHKAAKELGLFICENAEQCEKAWNIARHFVDIHSTTGVDIDTDKLVMRATPVIDSDLSLSISRLKLNKHRQQIFLDIRCRKSSLGMELCISPKVKAIRSSFSQFIQSGLGNAQ